MLKKLYIQNFRCFQNFTLDLTNKNSAILIGKNGTGKSSIFDVLSIFREIANGEVLLDNIIKKIDCRNAKEPVEFSIIADIDGKEMEYCIIIDFVKFDRARILEEYIRLDNKKLVSRKEGQTTKESNHKAEFIIDWHWACLPLIVTDEYGDDKYIDKFRQWLSNMIIIFPSPEFFEYKVNEDSKFLKRDCSNIASWARQLYVDMPETYNNIKKALENIFADFGMIKFNGEPIKECWIQFNDTKENKEFRLDKLSSGEKIYFTYAVLIASIAKFPNALYIWDEPNNYVSRNEMCNMISSLITNFKDTKAQILISSHNDITINRFSRENSFWLKRSTHLSPTQIMQIPNDMVLSEEYDLD